MFAHPVPEIPAFRNGTRDVVVVTIDRKMFRTNQWTLAHCADDEDALQKLQCKSNPRASVGLLGLFQHIAVHSWLGVRDKSGSGEAEEEGDGGPQGRENTFLDPENGRPVIRVQVYVHVARHAKTNDVIGFRFMFVNRDPNFDWDYAIDMLFLRNHELEKMLAMRGIRPKHASEKNSKELGGGGSPGEFTLIRDRREFVLKYLNKCYSRKLTTWGPFDDASVMHYALHKSSNPVKTAECLSLEHAQSFFGREEKRSRTPKFVTMKLRCKTQSRMSLIQWFAEPAFRKKNTQDADDEAECKGLSDDDDDDKDDDEDKDKTSLPSVDDNSNDGIASILGADDASSTKSASTKSHEPEEKFENVTTIRCKKDMYAIPFTMIAEKQLLMQNLNDMRLYENLDSGLLIAKFTSDSAGNQANPIEAKNIFEQCKPEIAAIIAKMKESGAGRREIFRALKGKYEALLVSADLPDGLKHAVNWLDTQRRIHDAKRAHNKSRQPFFVVHEGMRSFAAKLSPFANEVARMAQNLENLFDVNTLHEEIVYLYISSLGMYRIQDGLRSHTLHVGEKESGKSFAGLTLYDILIPKTAMKLNDTSQQAFTTNSKELEGKWIYMDECGRAIQSRGVDGTGDSIMKTVLSSGEVSQMMCFMNKNTGARDGVVTVSHCHFQLVTNSNGARTDLAEPICSRMFVRNVPNRTRQEKINKTYTTSSTGSKTERQKLKDDFVYSMRMIHALACRLQMLIMCGIMPDIDMKHGIQFFSLVKKRLASYGVELKNREEEKIILFMRSCVIFNAIVTVFFTNKVFSGNDAYTDEHLLECERALYLTPEIVMFALSSMSELFIDPTSFEVCRLVSSIARRPDGSIVYPASKRTVQATGDNNQGNGGERNGTTATIEYEYDYYYIQCDMTSDADKVLYKTAEKLSQRMKARNTVKYSKENVVDVLRSLEHSYMAVNPCLREGPLPEQPKDQMNARALMETQKMNVMGMHTNGMNRGMKFLRAYVDDKCQSGSRVDFFRKLFYSLNVDLGRDVCLLGITHRDEDSYSPAASGNSAIRKVMIPFLYYTISNKKTKSAEILVENPEYIDCSTASTDEQRRGIRKAQSAQKQYINITGCTRFGYREFCHERNLSPIDTDNAYDACNVKVYPDSLVDAYMRKISLNRTDDGSAASALQSETTASTVVSLAQFDTNDSSRDSPNNTNAANKPVVVAAKKKRKMQNTLAASLAMHDSDDDEVQIIQAHEASCSSSRSMFAGRDWKKSRFASSEHTETRANDYDPEVEVLYADENTRASFPSLGGRQPYTSHHFQDLT